MSPCDFFLCVLLYSYLRFTLISITSPQSYPSLQQGLHIHEEQGFVFACVLLDVLVLVFLLIWSTQIILPSIFCSRRQPFGINPACAFSASLHLAAEHNALFNLETSQDHWNKRKHTGYLICHVMLKGGVWDCFLQISGVSHGNL